MTRPQSAGATSTVVPLSISLLARGLTPRDQALLREHGRFLRRVELHEADEGDFALLYDADAGWARWGLARAEGAILLWNAMTLTDIGRFPSVPAALSVLNGATPQPARSALVLPFPRRAVTPTHRRA